MDALIDVTRECMRVLKPSGSLWVNLGDRYSSGNSGMTGLGEGREGGGSYTRQKVGAPRVEGMRPKSLIGVPWRYALRCIDDLGLILRAEVIWSKCLSGGTRVYAEVKGRPTAIRLHDLCRAYHPEDVRLWTGTQWSQVRAWEAAGRSEAQFEIELRSGERIGSTAEHRWPTSRGLLRSDQLAIGDVLDTAPLPEGTTHPEALDDEMVGWFVGLYIAEGSRSEQTIQIAGHVKEDERYRRLCEIAQAFHGTCKVYATGGNTATVNLTGPMFRAVLETYVGGRTAKDKHLQPKCWQRSNRFLRAVLDGYLSGDGGWDENLRRWTLGFTANDALAEDLRALAARLGLSLRLKRTTHYGFGKQWPGWGGTLYDDPSRRKDPDSQIVAIRPSRARQFWDIEIEDEPHLFALASGVLTHNSNGLPESVTDRVRRSHEQWFHMVKEPRYYSAVDEVREEYGAEPKTRGGYTGKAISSGDNRFNEHNPLGKLPGSVWTEGDGESIIGTVLGMVSRGSLTAEEGERILWAGRTSSGPRLTALATAGNGSVSSTGTDTDGTGAPVRETGERIDSSTSWQSDRSRMDSPSTTSAATGGVSGQSTWSRSRTGSTADDAPDRTDALLDTTTTSGTPTFDVTASESAEPAWLPELGSPGEGPPSTWVVPTEPLRVPEHLGVDHFAAFPSEFPKRIISGWSPRGVCVECNRGRIEHAQAQSQRQLPNLAETDSGVHRLRDDQRSAGLRPPGQRDQDVSGLAEAGLLDLGSDRGSDEVRRAVREVPHAQALGGGWQGAAEREEASAVLLRSPLGGPGPLQEALQPLEATRDTSRPVRTAGGLTCECPPGTPMRPAVILDPFGGTGTTSHVAHALGRQGISVDLSADYCRIARDPDVRGQRVAKVRGIKRERRVEAEGQADLFGGGVA